MIRNLSELKVGLTSHCDICIYKQTIQNFRIFLYYIIYICIVYVTAELTLKRDFTGKCGKCSMKSLAKMCITNTAPCILQAKFSRTRLENVSTQLQIRVTLELRHPYLGL
jgi:hypothetical protein